MLDGDKYCNEIDEGEGDLPWGTAEPPGPDPVLELSGRRVSFGISYNFRNPPRWERPAQDLYAQTLEHIEHAEQLGYDEVWTSEHHFLDDGYSPSVLPICAAIAARTSRVRIGTRVLLGPLYQPLRLAEDAATVDVISGGRFELGIGLGYRREEYEGLGIPTSQRGPRLEELVSLLRQAWSPGELAFEGRFHTCRGVSVTPKPVQQPIPIWLGGSTEVAARRAGRIADGLLAEGDLVRIYLEEWERERPGRVSRQTATMPWSLVAEDPEQAWAEIGEHVLYQRRNANEWLAKNGRPILFPNLPGTAAAGMSWNPDVIVTPARARELVEQKVARAQAAEVSVEWWGIPTGIQPAATHRSLELFAAAMFSPG
jgi:probable F420-dependent oxidoreductase